MLEILQYAGAGLLLGTMAGISPGPLLALVMNQSLKFGRKEGIKISFTPLITDLPAILLSLFLVSRLADYESVFGIISFLGAGYIIYLGYESIVTAGKPVELSQMSPNSLTKGILTNLLNPHPYLFWFTVGTPFMLKASDFSVFAAALFVFAFYLTIIGSKVVVAWLTDRSRSFLAGRAYVWTLRILGVLLIVLAVLLAKEGLKYL